jgi:uncharacterized membrane protein YpjA
MGRFFFNYKIMVMLFIVNVVGTLYGYYWYIPQLKETPVYFLLFVPDSPTASLFFSIFLFAYLTGKKYPIVEALAFLSLLKYGVWAIIMNVMTLIVNGTLDITGYMLMFSHGAMAVQAFIYSPLYNIKLSHLFIASVILLHNEIIDYVYGMMPVYHSLSKYSDHIGYFTFWLSILCIITVYFVSVRKEVQSYELVK